MSGSYVLYDSILEKCGNFWKNGSWGNTARADMAGLGSIGLNGKLEKMYDSRQYLKCVLPMVS